MKSEKKNSLKKKKKAVVGQFMVSLEWNVIFHILGKVKHKAEYSEVNTEFGMMSFHPEP